MDIEKKTGKKCPHTDANLLSKFFFFWLLPLFIKGSKDNLRIEDLYNTLDEDQSSKLGSTLAKEWEKQVALSKIKPHTSPSLIRVLTSLFGLSFSTQIVILAINMCIFRVAQPICLLWLIQSFENKDSYNDKLIYGMILCMAAAGNILCQRYNNHSLNLLGMRCRIACSSLIYRKTLKLSKTGESKTSIGQMVNLLSSDVSRFDRHIFTLPFLITTPMQFIAFTYILWVEMGISCLPGIGSLILLLPILYSCGKVVTFYRKKFATLADQRCKIMGEIISGIRVIKMYAWEKPFTAIVNNIRKCEIGKLKKRYYFIGICSCVNILFHKLTPFLIILTYVLLGNELTADKVFYTVVICNTLMQSMVIFIQALTLGVGELLVSINRIQKFLLLDERESKSAPEQIRGDSPVIELENVDASWNKETDATLRNINMKCCGNKLIAVVGAVGSGKSSLLNVLIGELETESGRQCVKGRISYASQEPWIFDGSIRQNIIFGNNYDKERYEKVTSAVALNDDFQQFPFGDLTRVGEKGVSLSGGQKSRVNLARALYQQADIYLLDDPLSAVDVHVGRHLFEECFKKQLKDTLRILVTHQLQFLKQVDYIYVVEKGNIVAEGTYADFEKNGMELLISLDLNVEEDTSIEKENLTLISSSETTSKHTLQEQQTVSQEKMLFGSITAETYKEYALTGHTICQLTFLCIIFTAHQIAFSLSDYWLSFWANAELINIEYISRNVTFIDDIQEENAYNASLIPIQSDSPQYLGQIFYIVVYSSLIFLSSFFSLCKSMGFTRYVMSIGKIIHDKMLTGVINSPVRFFDENPSGRLLNRFAKDMGQIDEILPTTSYDTLSILFRLLGVVAIVIAANYYMAVPTVFIFLLMWMTRRYYVKTSRDIKRIEGMTKSPVFSHISATLEGLATIRVCEVENKVIAEFDNLQDSHTSAWFAFLATSQCFSLWIESVSLILVIIVTFSFMIITSSTMAGNIGLAISSVLSLANAIQFGMRQSAETENLMTSVERALEYTKLKPEATAEKNPEPDVPVDWPNEGHIIFKNVSLTYGKVKVLKNISFEIKPSESIGIVGRTGAGKSSMVQALFRMTEFEGEILIDGISISEIDLQDIRKNISIIPQNPVLFSGTLRHNLDPFDEFTDDEIWKVIEEVELKESIPALDFKVSQAGNNFSVGQKQLICLARAILRRNKIVVMDEATANVDPKTDRLIHNTIREKFSHCTIVTIAHRLHSIMEANNILVLDQGEITEYGPPDDLLKNSASFLATMRQASMEGSLEEL